jgi:hypothetical protein
MAISSLSLASRPRPRSTASRNAMGMVRARKLGRMLKIELPDDRPGRALAHEQVGYIRQVGHQQDEREEDEADQERRGHLPEHVAIEDRRTEDQPSFGFIGRAKS